MRRLPHEVSAPRANATARNTIWTGTHQFYLPWMQFPRMYCSVAAAQAVTELFLCRRPLFDTLEHLAVATEDAIMVGDSIVGLQCAQAAGVAAIGVSFGCCKTPMRELCPDVTFDDYNEFGAACASLGLELP